MHVVHRFANCVIVVNARDHNPPHFHIRMNDGREALVEIGSLELLTADVARREVLEALTWARENTALLTDKFKEYNP